MHFLPAKKKTVHIPSGEGLHLFVIITDACNGGKHLMVSFSTIKKDMRYHDPACVLLPEDNHHRFITLKSFVSYAQIQERPTVRIVQCVENGSYIPSDDI